MKDWTALRAENEIVVGVAMLSLHIRSLEHGLRATERNLAHALRCHGCPHCELLKNTYGEEVNTHDGKPG